MAGAASLLFRLACCHRRSRTTGSSLLRAAGPLDKRPAPLRNAEPQAPPLERPHEWPADSEAAAPYPAGHAELVPAVGLRWEEPVHELKEDKDKKDEEEEEEEEEEHNNRSRREEVEENEESEDEDDHGNNNNEEEEEEEMEDNGEDEDESEAEDEEEERTLAPEADNAQDNEVNEQASAPALPTLTQQHTFLDAAKYYNFGRVRQLVLATPSLVNVQPACRWSALHQAAQFGDADTVRFLLEHGADLHARTRDGLTPLEVASPAVFDLLLEATLGGAEETNEPSRPKTSDETIAGLHVWRYETPARDAQGEGAAAGEAAVFQCSVCLQDVVEGEELRSLPCAHFFHTGCIDVWLRERSNSCPTCRFQVV